MSKTTSLCLIFLRLALGWTILVEGLEKVQKDNWTAEPYLREASGPLAPFYRQLAGDAVAQRLAIAPGDQGLPPTLEREWQSYHDRFLARYDLDDKQREEAAKKFIASKEKTFAWMVKEPMTIKKTSPWGPPVDVQKTPFEWREDYLVLRQKAENVEATELTVFGKSAEPKLTTAKGDASKLRAELQKGIAAQNAEMQQALASVLTPEQKKLEPPPYAAGPGWKFWTWRLLDWSDFIVKWGLTVAGVCLIAGLFSRTAAFVGAVLLLSFFLAMPPFPGTPSPARSEGTYLYFNKTFVEVLALLVLATIPTGRWLGLDGLIYLFKRKQESPVVPPPPAPPTIASAPAPDLLTIPPPSADNEPAAENAPPPSLSKDPTDGN